MITDKFILVQFNKNASSETPSTKVLVNENSQDLNQCRTSFDIYNLTNLNIYDGAEFNSSTNKCYALSRLSL